MIAILAPVRGTMLDLTVCRCQRIYELIADALRRRGDGALIRDVELSFAARSFAIGRPIPWLAPVARATGLFCMAASLGGPSVAPLESEKK